jgi:hypothetical protein
MSGITTPSLCVANPTKQAASLQIPLHIRFTPVLTSTSRGPARPISSKFGAPWSHEKKKPRSMETENERDSLGNFQVSLGSALWNGVGKTPRKLAQNRCQHVATWIQNLRSRYPSTAVTSSRGPMTGEDMPSTRAKATRVWWENPLQS